MSLVYLDGQKVSHDMIDPAKHRFIGLFREPEAPTTRYTMPDGSVGYGSVMICFCGAHLWDVGSVREHWRNGHFDSPQYVTMEARPHADPL